jgi:hypothetical protein
VRPLLLGSLAACLLLPPHLSQAEQAGGWGLHREPDGGWTIYRGDRTQLRPTLTAEVAGFWERNPWFGASRAVLGGHADDWGEGSVEAGLTASVSLESWGTLEARYSYVGAWTRGGIDATGSNFPDTTAESGRVEDLYVRWRSGDLLGALGQDALELGFGRQTYQVGTGFLFWDGSRNGGSRGASWLGPHEAFELVAFARLTTGPLTSELVYLKPDQGRDADTRMVGIHLDWDLGKRGSAGLGYYKAYNADARDRDGLWLLDARLALVPLSSLPGLTLSAECAYERNGGRLEAFGYYGELGYAFKNRSGKPFVSYRFAFFSGDKGSGPKNEGFDPLFYASSDWGTWDQGEIFGQYVLANQNLLTHTLRIRIEPDEALTASLLYLHLRLDERTTELSTPTGPLAADIRSKHMGDEIDLILDWKLNRYVSLSAVGAVAFPGDAAEDLTGEDSIWSHLMLWAVLSF